MNRGGIDNSNSEKETVFAKKGRKLNVIVPKMSPNREVNLVVPVTSASFENSFVVSMTSADYGNDVEKRKRGNESVGRKRNAIVQTTSPVCEINVIVPVTSETSENSVVVSMTSPDCKNDEEKRERSEETCIFRSILFIALIVGVPIAPSMLFPGRKCLISFLEKWNCLVFCFRTILFIIECLYNHCFWPSLAQRYSIHCSCLAGYVILLIFRVKRKEVETALWETTRLSSDLQPRGIHPLIRIYELFCFLCSVAHFSLGVYFLWVVWWDFTFERILNVYSLPEISALSYAFAWMVNLAEVLSYHIGAATLLTTTVLCSRYYLVSGEFIRLFDEKLGNDVSKRSLSITTTSRSLHLFKRVFSCVEAIDDALSVCAFVIYADVIYNYYVALTILLCGKEKYGAVEVLMIMGAHMLGASLKFLYLTLSGDLLSRRHLALKYDLIKMSDSVVRKSSKLGIHRFTIVAANIRMVDIHVTGMGYFKITRLIIPSAISALITYGVMIYKIGAIDDID